ncbi:C-GCAxxG-C-C family (seleno)protein [Muriicola sp. SD30]|uniref:C-GCAxxG-C-C family (seleno)protein n=1 Tax=Muriicola sp. SD30 TaxID=3240936 RepID=UPI0035102A05
MNSNVYDIQNAPTDGKKVFRELRTCSRTLCYMINREFGHPNELVERAADVLAGGILQQGHQCGMLWGASLAAGAESYRRFGNTDLAIKVTIKATQNIVSSFEQREKTTSCREITRCDFSNKLSFAKYMLSGRYRHCFELAQNWAPEAIKQAFESISRTQEDTTEFISCASEVARKMGANDKEIIMVAGFAGGLGLSGSACGALSTAIWIKSLQWCREVDGKSPIKNKRSEKVLKEFMNYTNSKIICSEITGIEFDSINAHTEFIRSGGCADLIDKLSRN